MKIEFIKKDQLFFKSQSLPLNKCVAKIHDETYHLVMDYHQNALITVYTDPCYFMQFSITEFMKTIVFPQFLNEKKIGRWKGEKDLLKVLPKYVKTMLNGLEIHVVGVSNNGKATRLHVATTYEHITGVDKDTKEDIVESNLYLGTVSLIRNGDKYYFANFEAILLPKPAVQGIMDVVYGGKYDPEQDLKDYEEQMKTEKEKEEN